MSSSSSSCCEDDGEDSDGGLSVPHEDGDARLPLSSAAAALSLGEEEEAAC